jgi:hypothetical protein
VAPGQFADSALNAVALMHSFFKRLALLLDATRLQQIVIFSHHNGSMSLLRPNAFGEVRAAMAMNAPLETVLDPMSCAFFEPTALRILKSSRTDRLVPGARKCRVLQQNRLLRCDPEPGGEEGKARCIPYAGVCKPARFARAAKRGKRWLLPSREEGKAGTGIESVILTPPRHKCLITR